MKIVHYCEFNATLRIKNHDSGDVDVKHFENLTGLFMGIVTACRDYAHLTSDEGRQFIKSILPDEPDWRFSGLALGLGMMGKLCSLTSLEILGLISSGHVPTEAAALVGLVCSMAGSCEGHLKKVLLMNIRQRGVINVMEQFHISSSLRITSPLALGILMLSSGDPTCSPILLDLISKDYANEDSSFDYESFVLHCGIGLALINLPSNQGRKNGIHPELVETLLQILQSPRKHYCVSAKTASIIALSTCSLVGLAGLQKVFQLECTPFQDLVLFKCLDYWSADGPSILKEYDHEIDDLDELISWISAYLVHGLRHLSTGSSKVDVKVDRLLDVLHLESRKPALSFSGRDQRYLYSTCYDLLLYGLSLHRVGCPDETSLRHLSKSFAESLDYNLGKSLVHSLALSMLTLDAVKLRAIRRNPISLVEFIFLIAVLPMAGMIPDLDPVVYFRPFLPVFLLKDFSVEGEAATRSTPLTQLSEWMTSIESIDLVNKVRRILAEFTKSPSIDEMLQMARM